MALFNNNRLTFDRHHDVFFSPWADPGGNIGTELGQYEDEFGSEILGPRDNLNRVTGSIFLLGHGNYAAKIGAGADQEMSAKALAKLLVARQLPQPMPAAIVVWTCWGGLPGGLAQELMIQLRNRGKKTTVWGCRYVTGMMNNGNFYVIPGVQFRVTGDTSLQPYGTGMTLFGQNYINGVGIITGNQRIAVESDMISYTGG